MTMYVAATNTLAWGRGRSPWVAVGNAISLSPKEPEQIIVFRVETQKPCSEEDVFVNDEGGIVAPPLSEVSQHCVINPAGSVISAFESFKESF